MNMHGYGLAVSAVVAVSVLLSVSAPTDASWQQQFAALWQHSELEFMGRTCHYSQKPKSRGLRLYLKGRFSCPSWNNITGRASTRSRSAVMRNTIEDYLNKARAAGHVTEEEARVWLQGYSS